MRKLQVLAFLLMASTHVFAQSIEITPLYGYTISGKVQGYYGTFDVKNDMSFGGILSVEIDHLSFVELSYLRTNTELVTSSFVNGSNRFDIGVEHYQAGFLREFGEGQLIPFAKLNLGTTRYVQTSRGSETYWLFSTGFGIGAKMFINDRIGFRLHTNLMLPMEFDGGGIFCGIDSKPR